MDMMYKPDDGNRGCGLGGVADEMLVTSRSSMDQEASPRLLALLRLRPDASDMAGVTGDSRCLMWSILQGASHFKPIEHIRNPFRCLGLI